jgi:hypothetical protein
LNSPHKFALLTLAIGALALMPGQSAAAGDPPILLLDVGYGDSVTAVAVDPTPAPESSATGRQATGTLKCTQKDGTYVLAPATTGADGIAFCITASTAGIGISFQLPQAFAFLTPANLTCTRLSGAKHLIGVVVRVGRVIRGRGLVYANQRAECDADAGFLYALSVETQNDPAFVANLAGKTDAMWTFLVPWNALQLGRDATSLYLTVNDEQVRIPLRISRANARYVSADFAPFIRLNTPAPSTGAAPPRLHGIELNGNYNPDQYNLIAASFGQNQSTVATQRALSQVLSLAPVTLPMAPTEVVIGADLQTQSQTLFAFQQPSVLLEDPNIKSLFDVQPFSVTKLSSLASGYAYGYASQPLKAGAFYGLQGPHTYARAESLTLALATPAPRATPTPAPSATPTPFSLNEVPTGNAPAHQPLQPPPPPAPVFEAATQSTPPLQLSLLNGAVQSNGTRDIIDALAIAGHVFQSTSTNGSVYRAETVNLFARVEHDFRNPILMVSPASQSQFAGESSTFTAGNATQARPSYVQLRETVGVQVNDPYFSPTTGTTTWLSALSGPVAHLTASVAEGQAAKYYALDLFGFRLTNVNGDIAAQEGWQISVPLPNSDPGWLLSGGSETQSVSDRIAAVEQGLLANYAAAFAQVVAPQPTVRPQRLGNLKLNSPWIFRSSHGRPDRNLKLQFVAGYDFGTVTACGATSNSKPSAPTFGCLTATDNRAVGGVFLESGKLALGATDTSVASGTLSSSDAARNLGTSGSLPGSTTVYLTYSLCPQISFALTNAAFPSGVPLPQQGTTVSGQVDVPVNFGAAQSNLILGYFNERDVTNALFNESGFSAVLRFGTTFRKVDKPAACNWN